MTTYKDLPEFTFTSDTVASMRDQLRAARATGSIVNVGGMPCIVRYPAMSDLVFDKRLRGMGMDLARMGGIPEDSATWRWMEKQLLFMDGDDHTRLRRLVAKAFTPRAVEALRPYARSVIRGLVDAVFDAGRCDAVASLTNPFPIPVICALLGVPSDRIADMSRWASAIVMVERADAGTHLAEIEQALSELDDFVDAEIALRRKAPRDDLLGRLIAVEEAGDRLSIDELKATVSGLLVAGTDTTRNQLANAIQTFTEYPNEWTLLRARPELLLNAVEETLRWQPVFVTNGRVTLEDVAVDGIVIPAGTYVVLVTLSANHDGAALPGAERFGILHEPPAGWRLLTFGGGVHYCLGASLARLELTEALAELSSRCADLRIDGEVIANPPGSPIRGYERLPIAWAT